MATIHITLDPANDTTIFVVHGELAADEIIRAIQTEYADNPTTHILWDLSAGSLDHITIDGFRRVAAVAKRIRLTGPHAKTAYVGGGDLGYGLLRMYTAVAEAAGIPVRYEVFRTRGEAMDWIARRDGQPSD